MVNFQEWLKSQEKQKYNTKEKREEITKLDISNQNLEGELDLSDFINLEELNCSDNNLTHVKLPNSKKLTILDLRNNNFSEQDLSFLSKFTDLEKLYLGTNNEKKINQGCYNRFFGSLKFLKDMKMLETLDVSDTDIDSGWVFLPQGLEEINCSSKRLEAKVKNIRKFLASYKNKKTGEEEKEDGYWEIDITNDNIRLNFWIDYGPKREEELERQLDNKNEEIFELERQLDTEKDLSKYFKEINSKRRKSEGEVSTLNKKLFNVIEEIKDKETNSQWNFELINKLNQEKKDLETKLKSKEKEVEDLKNGEKIIRKVGALENELKSARERFSDKVNKMASLEDRKKEINSQLEMFLEANKKLNNNRKDKDSKKKSNDAKEYLRQTGLDLTDLSNLSNIQKEIATKKEELDRFKKEINELYNSFLEEKALIEQK